MSENVSDNRNFESRQVPNDLEAERFLLGGILRDPEVMGTVIMVVTEEDFFYYERHKLIWRGLSGLYRKGTPIDLLTLSTELESYGKLAEAGGREYLFDLMKGRTKDSEFYFTFNEFHAEFERTTLNGKPDIDSLWLSVKRLFLTFEEWFRDYELYHYVGFLIGCSGDRALDCINMLRELSKNDKDVFKVKLKEEIKKQIPDDLESLEYGDKQIRSVLLLFNIVTVLQTQKSDMRFPFNRYKAENWDIEHVNSQTDQVITEDSRQRLWADDLLDYFVGATDSDSVMAYISDDNEDVDQTRKDFCRRILAIKEAKKIDDNDFDTLFKEIQVFFHEEKFSNKDNLYNLALLDANTNRSYGNAFFPIKLKRIIDNDSKGIFVPIATKNLFLKYYSTVSDNIMYWTEKDAADYLEAIKSVFNTFFSNPSEK